MGQKSYEAEFHRSEAKFRIVLETAAQGILLMNMHGQITMVNTKTEQLFGYDRDELIDTSLEILIPSAYRDIHMHHRNTYLTHPENRVMAPGKDLHGRRKDGTEFPIEVHLTSLEMYDGLNVVAFITDISAQKELQNKIRRMEKLEAIGQLAGGIAHDFNNVLAGVIGLTELGLRKLPADSDATHYFKMVIDKAQGAADLVKQLLAFSRQQVLSPKPLNLNQVIQKNHKLLQRYLGEDIRLSLFLDPNLYHIEADPSALDQIITNVCINARDAMPDGGDLDIRTENVSIADEDISIEKLAPQIDFIKLTITDNGIGMRQEVQKHVFEPFYSTKEFGQGTGLGLATVYGLVEQHGGATQFKSVPGEGTSFYMFFPAVKKVDNLDVQKSKSLKISGGNETILIVDDEQDIILTSSDTLTMAGYKVLSAQNGVEALELFKKNKAKIDLVISDIVMPMMGGIELKLLIRDEAPEVRFLHFSAYSDKIDPDFSYLQKPFLAEELLHKVREVLDQPAESKS